jgi:hypothetical protein
MAPLPARSFVRVPVNIAAGSGTRFADLTFRLPDGPLSGRISLAREPAGAGNNLVLMVGCARGIHEIHAIDKNNGNVVGKGAFEIADGEAGYDGPSYWSAAKGL